MLHVRPALASISHVKFRTLLRALEDLDRGQQKKNTSSFELLKWIKLKTGYAITSIYKVKTSPAKPLLSDLTDS